MKRKASVLCLVLIAISLSAADMYIQSGIAILSGDPSLIQNPLKDMNGSDCALVRISTDIAPFDKIESSLTPVQTIRRNGEVWVYLSPNDNQLNISKAGYNKLVYKSPIPIEENHVYALTILGSVPGKLQDKITSLVFKFNVPGVLISYNQNGTVSVPTTIGSLRLSKGQYEFSFRKEGYLPQTMMLDIDNDLALSINLQPGTDTRSFPGMMSIKIDSNPSGADIELNGIKVGTTPYQSTQYAGSYQLTLRKEFYCPLSKSIEIKQEKPFESTTNNLVPRFGYFSAIGKPEGAHVLVDGRDIGNIPISQTQIESGLHTLIVRADLYQDSTEVFTIHDNENKPFRIELISNAASLTIDSTPEQGAKVFIDGVQVGVTPYTNDHYAPGTYTVRVEKQKWSAAPETINVGQRSQVTRSFTMTQSSQPVEPQAQNCLLSVYSINMKNHKRVSGIGVMVDGSESGRKTPAVLSLSAGSHEITLNSSNYRSLSQTVMIQSGQNSEITFQLEPLNYKSTNFWGSSKWVALGTSGVFCLAGLYFNNKGKGASEDYTSATSSSMATHSWDDANSNYNNRNTCYIAAGVTFGFSTFSYVMELIRK